MARERHDAVPALRGRSDGVTASCRSRATLAARIFSRQVLPLLACWLLATAALAAPPDFVLGARDGKVASLVAAGRDLWAGEPALVASVADASTKLRSVRTAIAPAVEAGVARWSVDLPEVKATCEMTVRGATLSFAATLENPGPDYLTADTRLELLALRLPDAQWPTPSRGLRTSLPDEAPVLRLGSALGRVFAVADEPATPLQLGVQELNRVARLMIWPGKADLILPGESRKYKVSLRLGAADATAGQVAGDALGRYRGLWPAARPWPDRRSIRPVFLSSAGWRSPRNPDGYLGGTTDTTTPEGRAKFGEQLLAVADRQVAAMAAGDAQGCIVWDLEGYNTPWLVYVGDPRLLPRYAPAMDAAADAFFERIRAAGFRVGVTVRPLPVEAIPEEKRKLGAFSGNLWGSSRSVYRQGPDGDVADHISERIAYAKQRWGCTLFYIDTNGYLAPSWKQKLATHQGTLAHADEEWDNVIMTPAMWQKIAKAHPDVLLIPEHESLAYWACTTPLGGWTKPEIREVFPGGTTALFPQDALAFVQNFELFVEAVRGGDLILAGTDNPFVGAAYREAAWRKEPNDEQVARGGPPEWIALLADAQPLVRYQAGRALVSRKTLDAVPALLKLVAGDPEFALRRAAVDWVCALGGPRAMDGLIAYLRAASRQDALGEQVLARAVDLPEPEVLRLLDGFVATGRWDLPSRLIDQMAASPREWGAAVAEQLVTLQSYDENHIKHSANRFMHPRIDRFPALKPRYVQAMVDLVTLERKWPHMPVSVFKPLADLKVQAAVAPLIEYLKWVSKLPQDTANKGHLAEAVAALNRITGEKRTLEGWLQ